MRVRGRLVATAVLAIAALVGAVQAPAGAQPGTVHLVVTVNGSTVSDSGSIAYSVSVTNLGPDTATRLVGTAFPLSCATVATPIESCTVHYPLPALLRDLPAGATDTYLVEIPVATTAPHVQRVTFEVTHVEQHDVTSVAGTCDYGRNPQPDCATVATVLP